MIHAWGLLFMAGIILAGSEGPAFPWPNLAGILCLAIAVVGVRKTYEKGGDNAGKD